MNYKKDWKQCTRFSLFRITFPPLKKPIRSPSEAYYLNWKKGKRSTLVLKFFIFKTKNKFQNKNFQK
jgi:hypothetical protein